MVIAIIAMLAMAGLIIDGGNAFAQQRGTQNGADAAAEAGAVVLGANIFAINGGSTPPADADVLAAMNASATANGIAPFNPGGANNSVGLYTDFAGNLLTPGGAITTDPAAAAKVGDGTIPNCSGASCLDIGKASGVRAGANRDFQPLVSRMMGFSRFRASAVATAVSGYVAEPCTASQGCPLLPVTFSTQQNTCDGSGDAQYSSTTWVPPQPIANAATFSSANEVLLSLCKKGEGAFGWLDFGCGNTAAQILNPCNNSVSFPTWLQGQPGNPNNVEDELDTYAGNIVGTYEPGLDIEVLIPFFDATCNEDRPDSEAPDFSGTPPFPGQCTSNPSGGGANRHYHIPFFIGFVLDKAYVQGSNFPACNAPPGGPPTGPFPGGNGSGGCLKGWFARVILPPGPVSGIGSGGTASPITTQLIK